MGLEPTTLYTLHRVLYQLHARMFDIIMYIYMCFFFPPVPSTMQAECETGEVRLTDFTDDPDQSTKQGTLQICINRAWGGVCSDNRFGVNDARVACQQAGGYERESAEEIGSIRNSGPMFLSELGCDGDETSLLECRRFESIGAVCAGGQDAVIRCTGMDIRTFCIVGTIVLQSNDCCIILRYRSNIVSI